ncbi:uncharacterized protein DSM5745_06071 [Aspergillus mulundensis]|uniref:Uncharacterized protein n=1 Tax=Aspergillus mulundensis TaxID=1810919 RepID=A0A3D8RYU1_9EURO|nr:hypothetical protein DSM5745_06071 [Aspergillus mulundensis]RDW79219.1 hypothetical protein DSM5745_06071 [Aspergillus mulundensis]
MDKTSADKDTSKGNSDRGTPSTTVPASTFAFAPGGSPFVQRDNRGNMIMNTRQNARRVHGTRPRMRPAGTSPGPASVRALEPKVSDMRRGETRLRDEPQRDGQSGRKDAKSNDENVNKDEHANGSAASASISRVSLPKSKLPPTRAQSEKPNSTLTSSIRSSPGFQGIDASENAPIYDPGMNDRTIDIHATHPVRRPLDWLVTKRPAALIPRWQGDRRDLKAAFIQTRGPIAMTACTNCQEGKGMWKKCVERIQLEWRKSACANCVQSGQRCSNDVESAPLTADSDNAPASQLPMQETPSQTASTQTAPMQEISSLKTSSQETASLKTSSLKTSSPKKLSQKIASQETASQKTASEKTASTKTSLQEPASQKTSSHKTSSQEPASQKTSSHKTFSHKTSSHETSSQEPADILTQDILTQNILTRNILAGASLAEDILTQDILTQDILTQDILTQDILTQDILTQNILAGASLAKDILLAKDNLTQDILAGASLAEDFLAKDTLRESILAGDSLAEGTVQGHSEPSQPRGKRTPASENPSSQESQPAPSVLAAISAARPRTASTTTGANATLASATPAPGIASGTSAGRPFFDLGKSLSKRKNHIRRVTIDKATGNPLPLKEGDAKEPPRLKRPATEMDESSERTKKQKTKSG